jgi:hypothetical protein
MGEKVNLQVGLFKMIIARVVPVPVLNFSVSAFEPNVPAERKELVFFLLPVGYRNHLKEVLKVFY